MQHQDVLDLLWVDVDPAGHDHELLAVGQVEEALFVDVAHVPKGGPALGVEALAGLFRVVVVLEGGVAPSAEIDDSGLADRQLGIAVVAAADVDLSPDRAADRAGMREGVGGVIQVMPIPSVPE